MASTPRCATHPTPMGGDLPPRPVGAGAPAFLVMASRDPGGGGVTGTPLERIQIVKLWAGEDGAMHQAIHDVAGSAHSGAGVDTRTCEPGEGGHDGLCAVWRDPDFDPGRSAVYYARVLERPSCRWTTWTCNALPERERPAVCSDGSLPATVRERAWTSPIWYEPLP